MGLSNVLVKKYNNDLKGIVTINNKEYALDNLIVGEEVCVEESKDKTKCVLKKIIKQSNNRCNVTCPIYSKCGGCTLLHIKYDEQLKMKTSLVESLFFEEFNKYYPVLPTIGMDNPYHYRNKNQVVVRKAVGSKNNLLCGFYEEYSHNVVEYDTCLVQDEVSDKIISIIKELMVKMHFTAFDENRNTGLIKHILIKRSSTTKEVMVVIVTKDEVFPGSSNFVKALTARCKDIVTVIQNINQKNTTLVLGDKEKVLFGKGYITDILLNNKFKVSSKSFYQINSKMCEVLYRKAIDMAKLSKSDVLLDAYSGVGTIGLVCASSVSKVISVELVKSAVDDAISNAKINNIKNIHFFCADASDFIKNLASKKERVDVIVMDPPRKGSDVKFLNSVIKLAPKKVIYISCDPRTQVKDISILLSSGYSIMGIQPVDMFPHTMHIENIVFLQRK